jgi:4-nitrophenyl phosphatase
MDGLHQALEAQGFVLTDREPEYVVVGLDTEVNYRKLATAALAIRAGAAFIGTNPDRTLPTEEGLLPGAGALLAAIQAATDVAPKVIGKPEAEIFHTALAMLGTPPDTTAMLGDRLDTDILGAQRAGLRTILVLTGVATRADVEASPVRPDWVFEDLEALLRAWSG